MTPGIEYALAALLFFGIGDLIYKRGAAAGASPHEFLMVQSWVFLPAVALYGWFSGTLIFVPGTLWGSLAGVFILTGFYNFAHSLKTGSVSVNASVFRLSFVITAALAVLLLGEPLTAFKIAGIAFALAAVWLLLGAPPAAQAAVRRVNRSSLVRVLIAAAAIGTGNLILKYGLLTGATPASLMVAQAVTVVTLSIIMTALIDGRVRPSRAAWCHAPQAAIVLSCAMILMLISMLRGEASVMVPVAQMGFVVTALLGFVFLREAFTLRKAIGLMAALAALASLAAG